MSARPLAARPKAWHSPFPARQHHASAWHSPFRTRPHTTPVPGTGAGAESSPTRSARDAHDQPAAERLHPDGRDLVLGRADQRVADVVEEPVHLRLREVERHPDEPGEHAVGVVRVGLERRRAARRAAPCRRRRSRAIAHRRRGSRRTAAPASRPRPPRASSSSPSCSGRASARSRGRTGTRSRAARSAAGTRRGRGGRGRRAAPAPARAGTACPGWSASVHGHCRPMSSIRS